MLLGMGESVAFPSFGKIIALNVPQQHRGTANAMIMSGMSLGPAVGTFACGMSMARYGWRPVFIVIGLVSLLWVLPWLRYKPKNAIGGARVSASVSVLEILRQNRLLGSVGGPLLQQLSVLLHDRVAANVPGPRASPHYAADGREAALYYVAFAIMSPVSGWVADTFIRAGRDVTTVRKTSMAIGHSLVAAGVLMCSAADPHSC